MYLAANYHQYLLYMKKYLSLILVLSSLLLSSCFDILEEIFLEKNGKGQYLYTIDMSALMDESMKELLQGAGEEGEENSLEGVEIDSVVYFKDSDPEMLKKMDKPEIFQRAFMKIQMSDEEDKMVMQFGLDFENVDEISYFLQNIDKLMGDSMEGNPMGGGMLPSSDADEMFVQKGKKLTRLGSLALGGEEISEDDMGMLSMFMESATFRTIYHLPGKVKKTNIPGAVIDGNTLMIETSMLDIMKGEADQKGWVKFK